MAKKNTDKTTEKAVKKAPTKAAGKASAKKAPAKKSAEKNGASKEDAKYFLELDRYLFGQATHYDLYHKMGAHPATFEEKKGVWFVVWAPNAAAVAVVGDFNGWDPEKAPMFKTGDIGVYECFVPGAKVGQYYKFLIRTQSGENIYKADPYAFWAEKRPGTASRIADISFNWKDAEWIDKRTGTDPKSMPLSIYELHPGSWMKHAVRPEDNPEGFYTYRELAAPLAKYVKDMGYTHVELIGIAEHPLDASWGYQVTGYYAPTSRYGTPKDFKYLVNYLHERGIGVILDWVPAHFPKDAFGLADFDGLPVYEHQDPRKGEHPDWGTKIFNYGRPEVKNFLLANALFWVEEFHVDGLRVDAVSSMLYLNYGRKDGQWIPNEFGGHENLEAMEFMKHLNTLVTGRNHGVMMIAEESTAWPKITAPVEDDGLNFTFKWNMGWMHDFLEYMKLDPYFRKFNHNKMTFAMSYAYSENYILVLSHDEVVHLKCSMISKMPGYEVDKFENLKVGYSFMIGHPGKKLLFMGQDIGQYREWSEEREVDWFLLEDEKHQHLKAYVKDLQKLYRKYPACYETDWRGDGFQWINADDGDRSIYSFVRFACREGEKNLLFVCNFTPMARPDYRVGVPMEGKYKLVLDSRDKKYGGDHSPAKTYRAVNQECDNRPWSFAYDLPPYGAAVFEF